MRAECPLCPAQGGAASVPPSLAFSIPVLLDVRPQLLLLAWDDSLPHGFQREGTAFMGPEVRKDGHVVGCGQSGLSRWGEKLGNSVTSCLGPQD